MTNEYYFALGDVLKDLGLSQVAARREYKFDHKGNGYISHTGFVRLCNRPQQVKTRTVSILCNAMNIKPATLWRQEKNDKPNNNKGI